MDAKDWNGHTPTEPSPRPVVDLSGRSADYQLGYMQAQLDMQARIIEQGISNLTELTLQLGRERM